MKHAPFDTTGLASRLRRVTQIMLEDGDRAYAAAGLNFRTRLFPIVYGLHRDGPMTVRELTAFSGFSQPATSQTLKQLVEAGHVSISRGKDARERLVTLTPAGETLVASLQPFWRRARAAQERLLAETQPNFLEALASLEAALERRPLFERLQDVAAAERPGVVEVVPFTVAHRDAFRDLNLEWVRKHFKVEPHDEEQLSHPEHILEDGGEIWLARLDSEIVGTGVLYSEGGGSYEIAKMAVREDLRGHGIGKKVLETLIRRFRERGGSRLWLQTNSSLNAAIGLYRSFGFVDFTPDKPSPYERADVFLEWRATGG
jgi:ribosomal protein S18 acetylase RimI-like enzyme/DNA-binding HxlR family transcriptional regulator